MKRLKFFLKKKLCSNRTPYPARVPRYPYAHSRYGTPGPGPLHTKDPMHAPYVHSITIRSYYFILPLRYAHASVEHILE